MHPFADFLRRVHVCGLYTLTLFFSHSHAAHMLTRSPNNMPVQNSALHYISIMLCIIILLFHLLLYVSRVSVAAQKINIYTIFNFTEKIKQEGLHNNIIISKRISNEIFKLDFLFIMTIATQHYNIYYYNRLGRLYERFGRQAVWLIYCFIC